MYRQPLSQALGTESIRFGEGDDAPTTPPSPLTEDPGGEPTPRPWPTDPDKDDDSTPRPWPTDPDKDDDTAARPWPTDPDKDNEPQTRQFGGSQVSGKVYALLIGIDDYDMPRPKVDLNGCVRDSKEVERYLRENIDRAEQRLHLRCLRSPVTAADPDHPVAAEEHRSATRADIIEAFTEFLTQAGPEDAVFIHYSGHGTTYEKPEALRRLGPEENDSIRGEALVPQDAFMPNEKGVKIATIRDQEVRWMISRIAANNPHIVLAMDCCNSSGNTRAFEEEVSVRFTPPDEAAPGDIASFVFYQKDPGLREKFDQDRSDFIIPEGHHVALHACHNYELAKEPLFNPGPKKFGAFTYYLLQILRTTRGRISYRDLIKLVRAKTAGKVSFQSPQYYSPQSKDVDLHFLNGSVAKDQSTYTVTPGSEPGQGSMDAGSLHGIYPVAEGTTHLLLFPPGTDLKTAKAADGLTATVTEVKAHESQVQLAEGQQFADGIAFYQAIVTAEPMPVTKVGIVAEIDEDIVPADQDEKLAAGIAHLKAAIEANPFIQLTDEAADRQFKVFAYRYKGEDKFRIAEKDETSAMVQPKVGLTKNNAMNLVEELAHIARWERTLNLSNDHPAIIRPDDLELIAIDEEGNEIKDHNGSITFHLIAEDRPLQPPRQNPDGKEYIIEAKAGTEPKLKFKVALHNQQQVMLYCGLLHLASDFRISPDRLASDTHLGKTNYVEVDGTKINREIWEAYAGTHVPFKSGKTDPSGRFIYFSLPEGKTEDTDHFKLIASTEQFDPMHLYQAALKRASGTRGGSREAPKSQLSALMRTVATRAGDWGDEEELEAAEQVSDWWTSTMSVKIKHIPRPGEEAPQEAGK